MGKIAKLKPVLLFTVAVIIALATSVITYNWIKKETAAKQDAYKTLPVAVAITDLQWGTVINKEMVKTVPYLAGSLPEGSYFTDVVSLEGRILLSPVRANEPILKSRLTPESNETGGVAAVIDPNKRAMAVKVDKVIGVSGFIHPGNRVDVLVTIDRDRQKSPITKIVLQNILVLTTGTEMEKKGKDQKAVPVDVITLELMPEEAEKLALAVTEGRIQLALRSFNNVATVTTLGATIPRLLSGESGETERPKQAKTIKTTSKKLKEAVTHTEKKIVVEVLRGSRKTEENFKDESQL